MIKILNKIYWWTTLGCCLFVLVACITSPDFSTHLHCLWAIPIIAMILGAFCMIPVAVVFTIVLSFLPRTHPLRIEVEGRRLKGDEFDVFRR